MRRFRSRAIYATRTWCTFSLLALLLPTPMSSFNFPRLCANAAGASNMSTMGYDPYLHHHRHHRTTATAAAASHRNAINIIRNSFYDRQQHGRELPEIRRSSSPRGGQAQNKKSWKEQWLLKSGGGGGAGNAGGHVRNTNALDNDNRDRTATEHQPDAPTTRCGAAGSAGVQEGTAGGGCRGDTLVLERVKNIRDLGSIEGSCIVKGRVFRTGYLSEATKADADRLRGVTGLKTLVDLRSATELEKDELIHAEVYDGFENYGRRAKGRKSKRLQEQKENLDPDVAQHIWENQPAWHRGVGDDFTQAFWSGDEGMLVNPMEDVGDEDEESDRRRYFVSLIDESIYKKGVFQRLRRRHKAAVMALAPAMMVSRRCTKKARAIFLREINAGGLVLLNELLLQYSGKGINEVLRLLATRERHPVALYCTAGKDRTGLVMALTLAILGVPDELIVDDYAQSDAAYRELDDRDAMVGALTQEDLDPDTFLCAPRHVMEDILAFIRHRYGSVEDYLDSIGFDHEWRERLRDALLLE